MKIQQEVSEIRHADG